MAIEDWMGSSLDKACQVTIRRCYNGVIVRFYDVSTDRFGDELVFQDPTHLNDFIQQWLKSTVRSK